MSVVFIVVPAVAVSWPVMCGVAAAAAGALGFKTLKDAGQALQDTTPRQSQTEVCLEGSEILADSMQRESEFVLVRDDARATFRRAADGRVTVHVSGAGHTTEELNAIGKELLGKVTQQYAYHKVMGEMKRQGFNVTEEEVTGNQTIRIRVSRYV